MSINILCQGSEVCLSEAFLRLGGGIVIRKPGSSSPRRTELRLGEADSDQKKVVSSSPR